MPSHDARAPTTCAPAEPVVIAEKVAVAPVPLLVLGVASCGVVVSTPCQAMIWPSENPDAWLNVKLDDPSWTRTNM